jgi:hypothetical protein
MNMTNKTHKLSWQYDDLAQKIQVAPRHLAAKLVLRHLASKANDAGESRHGYFSIAKHCCIAQGKVSSALRYLRDKLKVVTWIAGTGGPKAQDTSVYTLNLRQMQHLVKTQGAFDPETGKLIRVLAPKGTGVLAPKGIRPKGSVVAPQGTRQPSVLAPNDVSPSSSGVCNPHEPPERANPQLSVNDGSVSFSKPDQESLPVGFVWRDGKAVLDGSVLPALPDGFVWQNGRPVCTGGAQ